MQLQDWIRRNGYNYRSFAEEIGVSFTKDEVTGHDFYEKQIQRHQTNVQRRSVR